MAEKTGDQIGQWTLQGQLGEGGNAVVWRATDTTGREAALKVLKARRTSTESYRRFIREIAFHVEHPRLTGVLPVIDAHLPTAPDRDDPPWLAMPVATPMAKALAVRPLEDVVGAISTVAAALAALEEEHNIGHRDIKPGNLYELDGEWFVGDFGLITDPDADTITNNGRQMGPAHFSAWEMIDHPATADPHPADVFSIGKTLWVLATEQNWPPLGHQQPGSDFAIASFRPHRNAARLDELIERTTRDLPADRPTKRQVAVDLEVWLKMPATAQSLDLSGRRTLIRAKLSRVFTDRERDERLREAEQALIRRLGELTAPLNTTLKENFPAVQIDISNDELTQNTVRSHLEMGGQAELLHRWQRCTLVAARAWPGEPALWMSRSIELFKDGRVAFAWLIHVSPQDVMGGVSYSQGLVEAAPADAVEGAAMIERQFQSMAAALDEGIDAYLGALPDS